jgi:hypothetical protein
MAAKSFVFQASGWSPVVVSAYAGHEQFARDAARGIEYVFQDDGKTL